MSSGEHTLSDDPVDIDRELRAAFALDAGGSRRFADDGFHEHVMERLVADTQARRRRQQGILMLTGFLSALGAASLAHSALSSLSDDLTEFLVDAGSAAGVTETISPVAVVTGLFLVWLLIDRMSEEYA